MLFQSCYLHDTNRGFLFNHFLYHTGHRRTVMLLHYQLFPGPENRCSKFSSTKCRKGNSRSRSARSSYGYSSSALPWFNNCSIASAGLLLFFSADTQPSIRMKFYSFFEISNSFYSKSTHIVHKKRSIDI